MTQNNLGKKQFISAHRKRVHYGGGDMAMQRQAWGWSRKLVITLYQHKGNMQWSQAVKTSKAAANDLLLPARSTSKGCHNFSNQCDWLATACSNIRIWGRHLIIKPQYLFTIFVR